MGNAAKVLVVDDSEEMRYIVSRALRRAGYEVSEAATGEEALRKAAERPDLVTLDIKLPDINGVEVCRRIKSNVELRSIPIIHTSATFVKGHHQAYGLESGADGYLTHPIEEVVLTATVKAFLRAREAEKEREQLLGQIKKSVEELQLERDLREKFVATLTHDLRSPLTAARMSSQLILRKSVDSEYVEVHATRIRNSIDRADRMIRDLLDSNRIRAGEKLPIEVGPCDLRAIAEAALADLTTIHGERFVLQAPTEIQGVWDPGALQRILENLCGNAVKYGDPYRPISVRLLEGEDSVEILVHNEGNPLSAEDQPGIFELYRRSASAQASGQKGWGLGLALVRGVAEAHGGNSSVKSSAEEGTTFGVHLPRYAKLDPRPRFLS